MANDKIMITVSVPEGRRAVVTITDWDGARVHQHEQEQTVTGGQSMDFFVDGIRGLSIKEGFPHCITDALDRKTVGSAETVAREKLGLGKDEPLA